MRVIPIKPIHSDLPKREKPDLDWCRNHIKNFAKYCDQVESVKKSEKEYQQFKRGIIV